MKKIIFLSLALGLVLTGAGCSSSGSGDITNTSTPAAYNSSTVQKEEVDGRVVVSITDSKVNSISGVSAVYVTVDKIEMHSAAKGWVIVSNETNQYELLSLKAKGSLKLAAQTMVPEGTYNQVRLQVKKIEVVRNGKRSVATVPSNKIELIGQFMVSHDSTTSITVDFLVDQSLRTTGGGKFIFSPVIKIESRANASVSIGPNNTVVVTGGRVDTDATMGMKLDGTMQDNFTLDAAGILEVANDKIQVINSDKTKTQVNTAVTGGLR